MNILLINPWIYDFSAYDLWLKPLGLLYIASFLEKFGYEVSFVDCLDRFHPSLRESTTLKEKNFSTGRFHHEAIEKPPLLRNIPRRYKRYGVSPEIFENELESIKKPDLVVITSIMTYWYPGVFEVIKTVKHKFPDAKIILGGIYATLCHEHAKRFSGADFIIKGRGEIDVLKIADKICDKKRNYETIGHDLDELPYPAYHLMRNRDSISMLTSCGCPLKCSYCASRILYSKFIQRDVEKVFHEIKHYVEDFCTKNIAFYDDALLENPKKHIIPLLDLIIDAKLPVRFHTPNGIRVSNIIEELAHKLRQANFKTLRLSFESATGWIQKTSSGKTSNKEFESAVENLSKAGYSSGEIETYILCGLPGQKYDEILDSMKFVNSCGGKVKLVEYSPIPGTRDYEKCIKQYGFKDLDPLLHNNSTFLLGGKETDYTHLMELKKIAQEMNNALTATPRAQKVRYF